MRQVGDLLILYQKGIYEHFQAFGGGLGAAFKGHLMPGIEAEVDHQPHKATDTSEPLATSAEKQPEPARNLLRGFSELAEL